MNIISIDSYRASQRIHPLSLLAQMSSRRANGCLRVSDGSTSWWIYLNNGDLVHASHSSAPFKRLEHHLRQMNQDAPSLGPTVRGQVHQLFNTVPEQDIEWLNPPDYQAVRWLVDKGHLTVPQAATLLEAMAKDVFETFLQVREGVHELVECPEFMNSSLLCLLELRPLVESCQQQLRKNGGRATSYVPSEEEHVPVDTMLPVANQNRVETSNESLPSSGVSASSKEFDVKVEPAPASQPASPKVTPHYLDNNVSVEDSSEGAEVKGIDSLSFSDSSTSNKPASFRPLDSSLQSTERRSSLSMFPNVPDQTAGSVEASASQLGTPAANSLNFRRPTSAPLDRRDSTPSAGSSGLSSRAKTGLPPASPVPQNTQARNSKLLRSPSAAKVSANPSLYRDNGQADITQRSSSKTSYRPSEGYTAPNSPPALGISKPQGEKLYKVACIDDSPMILHMIEAFLEDKSFSVIKINDPVRALMELMRAKPDIILLDITMPNLDGYELCALLRSRPDFRNTPIIMVTGSKGLIDRAKARLVKASGYLTKPFNQTQLLKMIFKLLK